MSARPDTSPLHQSVRSHSTARQTPLQVRKGLRGFFRSAIAPWRRAGSVLWLEVTGTLFALIALLSAWGVWGGRAHLLHRGPGQSHELAGVAMLAVFSWFTLTNFLRAHRLARRPC